ncbi:hypothetical protein WOLCODRAFT_16532 [Wolfiporia cocos MD-104 SS10]|uniref:DUF6533 domain-containing protein n=1 Tax=Wolfiporia cocos (strain MD-104) TaxID=742152 RepID=A0A2H3JUQ1_WOLCO|nr:hypothetical protein WOLCODRAFT_16532 [Wolfiporia cocos MD-104 SS10]
MSTFSSVFAGQSVLATEYFSAAALTISLWEHVLNLEEEIELVWHQPWSLLQMLVMVNRYGSEATLIFAAYTSHRCLQARPIEYDRNLAVLWENLKTVKYALIAGFAICFAITSVCSVANVLEIHDSLKYVEAIHACYLTAKSRYSIGVWGGMVLYDVYVFTLLLVNALSHPRRHDSEILAILSRNGALTFLVCFGLRLVQFIPITVAKPDQQFITPLIAWSLDGVMTFRLFLHMKSVEVQSRNGWDSVEGARSVYILEDIEFQVDE